MTTFTTGLPVSTTFAVIRCVDLTEGKGGSVADGFYSDLDDAEHAAYRADVQGSDATVVEVPINVIDTRSFIWASAAKVYGSIWAHGDRHARRAFVGRVTDIPDLTKAQWDEYWDLVEETGRNLIQERLSTRRAVISARRRPTQDAVYRVLVKQVDMYGTRDYEAGLLDGTVEQVVDVYARFLAEHGTRASYRLVGPDGKEVDLSQVPGTPEEQARDKALARLAELAG